MKNVLVVPGYGKEFNKELPFNARILSLPNSMNEPTIISIAIEIFNYILELQWTEFYLLGWDISAMALLQLVLLLNGRDDLQCNGLIVVGGAIRKPAGTLLQMLTVNDEGLADALAEFDISDQLHLIKTKVLWIHGERDQLVSAMEVMGLEKYFEVVTLPAAELSEQIEFLQLINKFISNNK